MLTRFHKMLLGLLAVQLVLIAIVMARGNDNGALKEHPLVPGFDVAKVTRVQVSGPGEGAKTVDLVKKDTGWVVASSFDYPADQAKVTDALTPITKLAAAAPIATQASRHKQLKVADGDFERKLVITRDGKDTTLYIGGSAGARRTAFRVGGEDSVYGVTGLSTGVIGTEPRQWVDASYVKVNKDEVAKVTVARAGTTVVLQKSAPPPPAGTGSGSSAGSASGSGAGSGSAAALDENPPAPPAAEHWNATVGGAPVTLAAGELIDEATIDRLVSEVTSLDLSAPADPKRDASKPTATITIDRKATTTSTAPTVIDVILDGSSYWVHDRSAPRAVLVDKARLDELVNVDRDKVVKKPPPPAPPPGAGSSAGAHPGGPGGAMMPPMPGAPGAMPRPPGGGAPPASGRPPTPPPTGAAPGSAAKPPAGVAPKPPAATGSAAKPGGS